MIRFTGIKTTLRLVAAMLLMLVMGVRAAWGQTNISSLSEITASGGHYIITQDITGGTPDVSTFSGTLEAAIDPDTHMPYRIRNLSAPLFTILTGTVKNLVLEDVDISQSGKVGSIACTANGAARIYNVGILSGSVGSTGTSTDDDSSADCCGGLVGELDGTARVINCYSYATITDGNYVGGIVGYNKVATASNNLGTMVFACMFYGDIKDDSRVKAPIYNGTNIVNKDANGVSNFNYFRLEAPYVKPTGVTYNCALGAEDRFLKRFEFYRHLLNSHRELAGWWATGTYSNSEMMKWVLEPSQLDGDTPYPILKASKDQNGNVIQYPSVVNLVKDNLKEFSNDKEIKKTQRNQGRKFGTLSVTIQMDDADDDEVPYHHPTGATLSKTSLSLPITDKDPKHYNFNYYKVQLPYYNGVGTKNYNGNRVVTGWKIVSITGGTEGSFTTGDDAEANAVGEITAAPYNFADRHCTNKDLYSESGRVFNQGAYWDVPEGVTAITLEPYWAKAAYVADAYADVVYNQGMTSANNVPNVGGGEKYKNNTNYNVAGEQQKVYTSVSNAVKALSPDASHTINDYAVVLVGNVHQYTGKNSAIGSSNKYTVTTIDLDGDNEPDYSFMLRDDGRNVMHPLKWDFLNLVGLGMAQKSTEGTGSYNLGILCPMGWFETTNTALLRVTQMEYEHSSRTATDALILQGGVMEQWVSSNQKGTSNKIPYIHVGGNVWFKEFHIGCHQDKQITTKHSPISVTGGDYDEFYLTGLYRGDVTSKGDNAECYINGGRFGIVCGSAMEGIGNANGSNNTGNITWQIQNADIDEFYAGGLNAASRKIAEGNLTTVVEGGYIKLFCGGPKFGDMNSGKTVITTANGTIFDSFFGAGYGGNSYSRQAPKNHNSVTNFPHNDSEAGNDNSWNAWLGRFYKQAYDATYGGVSTQFSYQFLPMSDNTSNVARIFVDYVKFSLATTHNVTSTLTDCTITENFYGGGSLGKVDGKVISTLNNCKVDGSVFGAGFSATLPTVEVDNIGFSTEPYYYTQLGTYRTGVKGSTTTYTWEHKDVVNSTEAIDKTNHILYTTEDLTGLGTVTGNVTLNIIGEETEIMGDVYGGGAQSKSNTDYYKASPTADELKTKTTVNLLAGTIDGDAYGGGLGSLGVKNASDPTKYDENPVAADVGNTILNLNGVDYSTDNATQTLYTSWGLVIDETSTGTPYVVDDTNKGCIVKGNIFGCNNLNGTPKGSATVHIYKTQNADASQIINSEASGDNPAVSNAKVSGQYDVKAVYGGGNLAPYVPNGPSATATNDDHKNTTQTTNVIIDGCDRTSIQQVYGGGNAASTPATKVNVYGTYEIGELFGGGNGKDKITVNNVLKDNPGANVGYEEYADDATNAQTPDDREDNYGYGSGKAEVNIYGGKIHSIYGGSNTKGNVRRIAVAMLEELQANGKPICHFDVDEAYGGGKSATMDGEAHLEMKCIPGMTAAYGGAENADIQNNVTLNITNGKFGQVFGGNNFGGRIMGSITVNIEETGCRPVIIGELYGGGNRASYSVYGYKEEKDEDDNIVYDDFGKIKWQPLVKGETGALSETAKYGYPQVNVKSFTSIGEVYGGGYGTSATMVGDPHVNINVVLGDQRNHTEANIATEGTLTIIDETEDHLETTREVNYPTHTKGNYIGAIRNVFGGGNAAKVIGDTYVNIGTAEKIDYVTKGSEDTDPRTGITVVGADIRGNVYGGGNKADVFGKTNVTIGKQQTTTP